MPRGVASVPGARHGSQAALRGKILRECARYRNEDGDLPHEATGRVPCLGIDLRGSGGIHWPSIPRVALAHGGGEVDDGSRWVTQFTPTPQRSYSYSRHSVDTASNSPLAHCASVPPPRHREALYFRVKAASVFCIEPEGDSPDRKSIYDSLLLGCIPVVFSRRSFALSPLHWDIRWKPTSAVYIDYGDFMDGRIDVLEYLRQRFEENGAEMQEAIRENAHSLQFSLVGSADPDSGIDGVGEDALLRMLAALKNRADFIDVNMRRGSGGGG